MTLPGASEHSQPTDTAEARQYNRIRRWLGVADTSLGFLFFLVLLLTGWTADLRDAAWHASGNRYALALFFYVGMLAVIGKLLTLWLDYYSFRLEHRFHLSNQKIKGWLADEGKGWLVGLAMGAVLAEIVYWLIRSSPLWWLWSWMVFIALFIFFAQIAPVLLFPLFYKFVPLEDEELKQRLTRLSERAGTRVRGIYEWKLSEKSKKANAALTGLGNTRRILISDTLLNNYTHDEIEAVLAHELGHHVHGHIARSIVLQTVVTFVGFWAANEALVDAVHQTAMFGGLYDFANLPLLVLVVSVLSLLLLPALNAYSRHNERQADTYCWKAVPSIGPFVSAMDKLSRQNLAERNPSRIVEALFHSHPAVSKRIAAAQAYASAKG